MYTIYRYKYEKEKSYKHFKTTTEIKKNDEKAYYAQIYSKLQHSPRTTPCAFELFKIGLFKFLPPGGAKIAFKDPTQFFLKEKISDRDYLHRHGLSFKLWLSLTL